jgi:acyl carrier protein
MELVAEIEEAFGIMLDTEDVLALSSFKEAIRILTNYGVSFDG